MTERQFINSLSNGKVDVIENLIKLFNKSGAAYCLIGGLAVNAYADPVVSLDIDLVISIDAIDSVLGAVKNEFEIQRFPHSVNLSSKNSDIRIQLQTDPRYQDFISSAVDKTVLGYVMPVATIENVLKGKIWAYLDPERRGSKRQKDLADIARLIENFPDLKVQLPDEIVKKIV